MKETLSALKEFPTKKILFTGSNADPGGMQINKSLRAFVEKTKGHCLFFDHLGMQGYLSVLSRVTVVIGNSSSGIIEAPSFSVPTVNIGDRQKGRVRANSIIDCPAKKDEIVDAIRRAEKFRIKMKGSEVENPYDRKGTARLIVETLANTNLATLNRKPFKDVKSCCDDTDFSME